MSQDQRAPGPHGCSIWHCPGTLMGAQSVPTPASEPRAFRGTSRGLGHEPRAGARCPRHVEGDPEAAQGPFNPRPGREGPWDDRAAWGAVDSRAPGFRASAPALVQGQPDAGAGPAQISGSTAWWDVQTKRTCGSWEGAGMGPRLLPQLLPGPRALSQVSYLGRGTMIELPA